MSRLFVLVDGSSLVHRAFYALPELRTASGIYTNAVYGFATMLLKLMEDLSPDEVVVAFDKGKVTFRNGVYSEYKAHRKPTPSELSEQFPLVREFVKAVGITAIEEEGFEADDIIGTLARKAEEAGFQVLIVTGDRDVLQLITDNTKIMLTRRGITDMELVDCQAFESKYGIKVEQFVDLKGLMGDSSDNIPGVPGVGEKTAIKLIQKFGSMENILNSVEQVQGVKLREKLLANADLALISKQLSRIECNMPLEFSVERFTVKPEPDWLQELCMRLEFKSLPARIGKIFPGNKCSLESTMVSVCLPEAECLYDAASIDAVIQFIRQKSLMIFYPIVEGNVPSVSFKGIGLAIDGRRVYISADSDKWESVLQLFADASIAKITHDAKGVYSACFSANIPFAGLRSDTLIAAYLIDPTAAEYTVLGIYEKYLESQTGFPASIQKHGGDFAAWAAGAVQEMYAVLENRLGELALDKLYYQIELPLVEALANLEICGIKVDREYLTDMSAEIAEKVQALLIEIHQLAGEEFNVNSTKQLGAILFDKLGLPVLKKTKTGYSTDAEVLEKLAGSHPVIDKLLEYRLLTKLKSTYLDGMHTLINPATGRVHTTFNQTVTATGRLSSSEPNLQNIPIRTEVGRRIRELFIPDEGFEYLMTADYSQIELRVLAHLSNDENLIDAFLRDQDIHTRTAAEVFDLTMEQVTPELRSRAKAVNFGIVYGISDYGLSRDTGVSRKEAGLFIENYFKRYQGVKRFMEDTVIKAREDGFVTTLFGRRRYLPDINSRNFNIRSFAERTAMNTPIQGTAADIIKKAMLDVSVALREHNLRSRVVLQVHDELVLEVVSQEASQVAKLVKTAMEKATTLAVPLTVDINIGKNWAKAK